MEISMPKILLFVWRLLQQLTKPFWCSVLGIWRWWQFQRWQSQETKLAHTNRQITVKAEEK